MRYVLHSWPDCKVLLLFWVACVQAADGVFHKAYINQNSRRFSVRMTLWLWVWQHASVTPRQTGATSLYLIFNEMMFMDLSPYDTHPNKFISTHGEKKLYLKQNWSDSWCIIKKYYTKPKYQTNTNNLNEGT